MIDETHLFPSRIMIAALGVRGAEVSALKQISRMNLDGPFPRHRQANPTLGVLNRILHRRIGSLRNLRRLFQPTASRRFAMFLLLIALSVHRADAATLWAVLAADTDDASIGDAVEVDLDKMVVLAQDIARETGLDLEMTVLDGRKVTARSVVGAVDQIRPTGDDVVFFYYSGHGTREDQSNDPWPLLAMQDGLVPFTDLLARLDDHDPRLVIAVSDTCNRSLRDRQTTEDSVASAATAQALPSRDRGGYESLFTEAAGYFVATASSPGELARAEQKGSNFTRSFETSIRYTLGIQGDWNDVAAIAGEPLLVMLDNPLARPMVQMSIAGKDQKRLAYPF